MKEHLVNQLKTQVTDLERFIQFIQIGHCPSHKQKRGFKCTCNCPLHGNLQSSLKKYTTFDSYELKCKSAKSKKSFKFKKPELGVASNMEETNDEMNISKFVKRFLTLLQIFTFVQFGCNSNSWSFENNTVKRTFHGNDWGDLKAKLEMIVNKIIEIRAENSSNDSDCSSEEKEVSHFQLNH